MTALEIIVVVCCVLIVGGVVFNYLYRKRKGLPTGECRDCVFANKKKFLKEYYKKEKARIKKTNRL